MNQPIACFPTNSNVVLALSNIARMFKRLDAALQRRARRRGHCD